MRTKRVSDSATNHLGEPRRSVETTVSDEVEAYVGSARRVEMMALDLAQRNVREEVAIQALIEAAGGDVRVMRRAHRHCEFALSEQYPAGRTLIRAFDYLSAGRRELQLAQATAVTKRDRVAETGAALFEFASDSHADDPPVRTGVRHDGRFVGKSCVTPVESTIRGGE